MVTTVKGDLIALAKQGRFDVITHGCNCFCRMKRGIAPQMVKAFGCNNHELYELESLLFEGDPNKLGQIQGFPHPILDGEGLVYVYNLYSQYHWSRPSPYGIPLDYDALRLGFRKINIDADFRFPVTVPGDKLKIGLPKIGCGLAGGDWDKVSKIIEEELTNFDITIVEYGRE